MEMVESASQPRLLDLWIPGVPATFATRGERRWKETISNSLTNVALVSGARGLIAEFALLGAQTGGHAADVDNLCEPLLSTLVNRHGWFDGRRPNIEWLRVTKRYIGESGVHITILDSEPIPLIMPDSAMVLHEIYTGPIPKSARDETLAGWAQRSALTEHHADRYSVLLQFGDLGVNLGEIATGRIKSIVDCLYPVLGGRPGAPEDWRIYRLQVEKVSPVIPPGSVRVAVWST